MKLLLALVLAAGTSFAGVLDLQQTRWDTATIRPEKRHAVESTLATMQRNQARYATVSKQTRVPWLIIASLHQMECSGSFRMGLYCGDPLTARTRHVPKGRPTFGTPPFTWEETAVDALRLDGLDKENWSPRSQALQNVERYNGLAYQRRGIPSPYLWSWTTVYTRGKYVADGVFSPTAISQQCGVAPFLILTK